MEACSFWKNALVLLMVANVVPVSYRAGFRALMCAIITVLFTHGHRMKSKMMGMRHSRDTMCVYL